jgi:LacI family transcriptional regulator
MASQPAAEKAGTRAVTLAVIAKAAGVSLPTVSKVIRGRPDVAPETRQAIERLLAEYGYVPRATRRRAPKRRTLDLAFDALGSAYGLELINGVVTAAAEAGVDVVVGLTPDEPRGIQWAQRLTDAGRMGVISVTSSITAEQVTHFRRAGIPLVVIDPDDVPEGVPSIGATNWLGGLTATEHLLELGHRRVATITGRPTALCARARLHGYRAALEEAKIPPDPKLVRQGDFGFDLARREALELLALPDRPTAIFAANDYQAFGVVEAARICGLRVPEDLSVVGFDDVAISRWAAPPLTTIHQPLVKMGRVACQTLLAMAAGERPESDRIELATHLVVRDSTAPPPSAAGSER